MTKTATNDDMVLGMIMNPETPFEAVESNAASQEKTKIDSKAFETQFGSATIAKYKMSELIWSQLCNLGLNERAQSVHSY